MARIVYGAVDVVCFNNTPQIHDDNPSMGSDISGRSKVMGYVYEGNIVLLVHARHQVQKRYAERYMLGIGQADSRYCIETMNHIVLEFFNYALKDGADLHLQTEY